MSRTVRVRIAVAVDGYGDAAVVFGAPDETDAEALLSAAGLLECWDPNERLRFCWVEADVPLPEPRVDPVVEGRVCP